jgi:hypothetical protein
MAISPGMANFYTGTAAAPNQIRIGFDPKSINEVISGCWGMAAYAGATAWRYSREIALETYRQIVANHPRDTRFSVRQIQVNYTINNTESTRGENYDYGMSKWIMIGKKPNGYPRFRLRSGNDTAQRAPYATPESEQMGRARFLSGERHRSVLMPVETAEFKAWSKRKTMFVFSNVKYERYLNYGSQGRPGKFYWETAFGTAAAKANQALASLGGFNQAMISSQQSQIDHYRSIVNDFIGTSIYP